MTIHDHDHFFDSIFDDQAEAVLRADVIGELPCVCSGLDARYVQSETQRRLAAWIADDRPSMAGVAGVSA